MSLSTGNKLVLGLREVGSGDALSQFQCLKDIIGELCANDDNKIKKMFSSIRKIKKMFSSIRNTMSDRHIVQKNFTKLLEEYRVSILPEVISNWSSITEDDKQSLSKINDFFCGLHFVVGLADISESMG